MDFIEEAQKLFGSVPRPRRFTDVQHCCECAEHDELLRSHDPDSIGHRELGSPAWDPICFTTTAAFRYYFPALVRLAVQGQGEHYYLDQFLFHIISDGPGNDRWKSFSSEERSYVAKLLRYFLDTRAEEIEQNNDADHLMTALRIWSEEDE
jgi:hypothetical protein